jgi:hypothetical protein
MPEVRPNYGESALGMTVASGENLMVTKTLFRTKEEAKVYQSRLK